MAERKTLGRANSLPVRARDDAAPKSSVAEIGKPRLARTSSLGAEGPGVFGDQAPDSAARCLVHHDFNMSGHFPKCTRQIKKGLPCKCVAKRCAGCAPDRNATCASPDACGKLVGNAEIVFCDVCRADCANPSTCGRYIHGVDCVVCGAFSDGQICRPCEHRDAAAQRAAEPASKSASTTMARAISEATAALQAAAPGEHIASKVFGKLTATMTSQLDDAGEPPQTGIGKEARADDILAGADAALHEVLAQLKGSAAEVSLAAVISTTEGMRNIAEQVSLAAKASAQVPEPLPANYAKMVHAAAELESGDGEMVLAWLRAGHFPTGFLARELLRDFLKQVSHKQGLQMPKTPSDAQVQTLAGRLSQEHVADLSKELMAQVRQVAKLGAEEAQKTLEVLPRALPSVVYQIERLCEHWMKTAAAVNAAADEYAQKVEGGGRVRGNEEEARGHEVAERANARRHDCCVSC